jgi:triosephosphate isomerase
MRIPFIAGNWKMNTTIDEAVKLVGMMRPVLDAIKGVEKAVCPPFISLAAVKEVIKGSSVKLGAQNLYFEEKGAYTGEVSPLMLAELCDYVIVGHSERRGYFGENDQIVNKKLVAALKVGLKPILCVGENLKQNEAGKTKEVVTGQVKNGLAGLPYAADLVIAYEPIWAIGTGKAATGIQANETIGLIREQFAALYGNENSQKLRILYGGSVTADNIAEFISHKEIDGGLVGGASLKIDQFVSIVKQTSEIKKKPF